MADGGIVGKGSRRASGGNAFVMGDINVNVASQGSSGDPAKDEQHNRSMAKQGGSGDRSADDGMDHETDAPGRLAVRKALTQIAVANYTAQRSMPLQ